MIRNSCLAFLVVILIATLALAQEPKSETRLDPASIELGPLADSISLVEAKLMNYDRSSSFIQLKLRAKKAIDTAKLGLHAGFFDETSHLLDVSDVSFEEPFPLEAGESASAKFLADVLPTEAGAPAWKRIALRQHK